ncbi:FAD-dependent monooxygenase [Dactylosporangium aurantiacum]|uniref:FAD-dependent monooxygenase n=1 Tax=Dactylosporangium aurantiacum TaxID=35754 RepID=A0A9Q9IJL1_9ACTN|nr:FAD-dependent monooxygenase [Dactylosporangium aurantiacum]MDG6108507.1 FAD-dependent monooxygenase [Dactylosporangium aurantiacum]UWZ57317.1 FAD-dependent monooxygenase [Dactylosporangium aurantiacum]
MTPPTVLISGAGVAGPTLAHFLARHGFRPTVVERARGLRSSGNPVDVRGPALPVAEELGIMAELRAAATHATSMLVIDGKGRPARRMPMPTSKSAAGNREVELPRGDLAAILQKAARDDAELLWDDTVTSVRQDGGGVDVMFERAAPRRFDLLVGADGLHSTVRRLVFGPEPDFVRHMGVWVATMPLDGPSDHPHDVLMHNTPGRLVSIHPSTGRAMAAFIFRGPMVDGFDHRDTAQHKRIVTQAYAGAGWRVPQLLEQVQATTDLYFDSVSQVRLPSWSRGRVTLLGDAASCVSLFGDGSSLAMAGAHTLAAALAASRTDHASAFAAYEKAHRTHTDAKQRGAGIATAMLIPKTRLGIATRNVAARVLLAHG